MNQGKLKYARERLNVLMAQAIDKASPEYEEELTYLDAANMLLTGEKTIRWEDFDQNNRSEYRLNEFVSEQFDSFINEKNKKIRGRNSIKRKEFKKVEQRIRQSKIDVEDELVLGDEAKALELLALFARENT